MVFNREDFNQALVDIEHYIGYLKGNEMAYDYLMMMWGDLVDRYSHAPGHPVGLALDWEYKFPCPEERFKVHPGARWTPGVKQDIDNPVDWDAYVKEVQVQTDIAYKQGLDWAAGLSGYLRSVCDQFLKPDVEVLRDNILDMHRDVVMELADAPNDDWARLGDLSTRWTGDAAASFNEFYQNYNDVLARSGRFAYLVNLGASAATKVISSTQFGALEYVQGMRDGLVKQLDQWVHDGWKPYNPTNDKFPDWVTDLATVADSALTVTSDYVPGVAEVLDVKDNLKNIGDLIGSVADLAGIELPKAYKRVPVKTSDEIYTAVTTALSTDYLEGYHKALDKLNAGGAGGGSIEEQAFSGKGVVDLMQEDKHDGDWSLPEVNPEKLNDPSDDY